MEMAEEGAFFAPPDIGLYIVGNNNVLNEECRSPFSPPKLAFH